MPKGCYSPTMYTVRMPSTGVPRNLRVNLMGAKGHKLKTPRNHLTMIAGPGRERKFARSESASAGHRRKKSSQKGWQSSSACCTQSNRRLRTKGIENEREEQKIAQQERRRQEPDAAVAKVAAKRKAPWATDSGVDLLTDPLLDQVLPRTNPEIRRHVCSQSAQGAG